MVFKVVLLLLLLLSLALMSTALSNNKKFVYLIQSGEDMPLPPGMIGSDADAVLITWKKPSTNPEIPFFPSTHNEGRNKLIEIARQRGDYLYYIFADHDLDLVEKKDYGKNTGNPFRTFEKYLIEWEPAIGVANYMGQAYNESLEVQLTYGFDAIFGAYHRDVVDFVLPYTLEFENESWWYSMFCVNTLAAAFFNEHRIQFNAVEVLPGKSIGHLIYPHERDYHRPFDWLLPAILDEASKKELRYNPHDEDFTWPLTGQPKKKSSTYKIDTSRYAFCHDYFFRNHTTYHSCNDDRSNQIKITYPCNDRKYENAVFGQVVSVDLYFELPCAAEGIVMIKIDNSQFQKQAVSSSSSTMKQAHRLSLQVNANDSPHHSIQLCLSDTDHCDAIQIHVYNHVSEFHPVPKVRFVSPRRNDTVLQVRPNGDVGISYFSDNFKMPEEGGVEVYLDGNLAVKTQQQEVYVSLKGVLAPGFHTAVLQMYSPEGEDVGEPAMLHFIMPRTDGDNSDSTTNDFDDDSDAKYKDDL